MNSKNGDLLLYQDADGKIKIDVHLKDETVWITQKHMSDLFGKTKSTINEHIKNIYKEAELEQKASIRNFRIVQKEGSRQVVRNIEHYNLDVIISVGYRVKSQQGVQFRKWATQRLKDYLVQGYAINQQRLEQNQQSFLQTLEDLKTLAKNNSQLTSDEILCLIQSFSDTWFILDSFDKTAFPLHENSKNLQVSVESLKQGLAKLKAELISKQQATDLFAQEKNPGSLEGILGNVMQSLFGEDAYPSLAEKAAHLLYFIVKNHPFNDGNKRSGAFAFIWLLQRFDYNFYNKINPQALSALTLLIAQSKPSDKDKMIGMVKLMLHSQVQNI